MTEPSEYEWSMMRFKTSLKLGLKEIKIIENSHKNPRLHSLGPLAGRGKKISCIFVVDHNNYKLINSGRVAEIRPN